MVEQQKIVLLAAGFAGALMAAVLLVGTVAEVAAQDGRARPGFARGGGPGGLGLFGPGGAGIEGANLTDAQKDQVKAIVDSHRDEMKAIADRGRPAHEALDAAITAETFDEATIRARSMDVATVDADMLVLQSRMRSEIFQILTPEQQAEAKRFQSERPRGPRMERGRGQRPAQ